MGCGEEVGEILVYNDGSVDETAEILRELAGEDRRISWVDDGDNRGVVARQRSGLERVTGDYLYFASADDQILGAFLAQARGLLLATEWTGFYCGDYYFKEVDSGNWIEHRVGDWSSSTSGAVYRAAVEKGVRAKFHGCTTVYRTKALREIGGFDPALRWYADWFAIQHLALRNGFAYGRGPQAVFRWNVAGYSLQGKREPHGQAGVLKALVKKISEETDAEVQTGFCSLGALTFMSQGACSLLGEVLWTPRRWRLARPRLVWEWLKELVRPGLWRCLQAVVQSKGIDRWRRRILQIFGAHVDASAIVERGVWIERPWRLTLGEGARIKSGARLTGKESIIVEKNVVVASGFVGKTDQIITDFHGPLEWPEKGEPGRLSRSEPLTVTSSG
jgi:glycosyltransferase involved in cell wall biosynthesis